MTDTELRRRRIALYGVISVGLHDSEELRLDATEIPSGGWTDRNGDEDDRLYGQAAFDHIKECIAYMTVAIDNRFSLYREEGGNSTEVLADVAHALTVIHERELDVERRVDKCGPKWDLKEAFGVEEGRLL
ncbi:hypothetical protein BPNPMPFG_006307 [Mesorhizobium sp. AR07]|uniref:hypothetical protein n=1 Tax=Mesorhizobium sp. AR07 TaxID=2865838 RepID=UPI002160148E|nr:hypothetical protein [Mesorhizobium sp. AR07]UVK44392.1 hypothetical protein BPNPMPFG_006307 [Mesorhizobium sp. AR07]